MMFFAAWHAADFVPTKKERKKEEKK